MSRALSRAALATTLTVQPAPPAPPVTIAEVLNFALNLEYSGGGVLLLLHHGHDGQRQVHPYGPVSFGPVSFGPDSGATTGNTAPVTFPAATGSLAISKPAINLSALDALLPAGLSSFGRFLVLSRSFEDTGASAYTGASILVRSNPTVLLTAAQILGVEVYHAQSARVLLAQNGLSAPKLDPLDTPPPPAGTFYFDVALANGASTPTALTVTRNASQVLSASRLAVGPDVTTVTL